MSDVAPIRGAVSTLSAHLLRSPTREAVVAAATRRGLYLLVAVAGVDGADGAEDVLPVVTSDALLLPTAVRLPVASGAVDWGVEPGERVRVGDAAVLTPTLRIAVVRTVRPARVRPARSPDPRPLAPHTAVVADLLTRVGAGPGLTPEADDELCGHLLVGWACGTPGPALEPVLHRTTAVSASFLRAAAQGYAVPEVVAYVDAVLGADPGGARGLRRAVSAIGHTSGPALLRGVDAAASLLQPHQPFVERTVA